eukprot:5649933-Prymnesium_polylepis.1
MLQEVSTRSPPHHHHHQPPPPPPQYLLASFTSATIVHSLRTQDSFAYGRAAHVDFAEQFLHQSYDLHLTSADGSCAAQ